MTFVNGRPRRDILPELEKRMNNSTLLELETGLEAMILIAHDRLEKLKSKM